MQHGNGTGGLHGRRQYLRHRICRGERRVVAVDGVEGGCLIRLGSGSNILSEPASSQYGNLWVPIGKGVAGTVSCQMGEGAWMVGRVLMKQELQAPITMALRHGLAAGAAVKTCCTWSWMSCEPATALPGSQEKECVLFAAYLLLLQSPPTKVRPAAD